MEQPKLITGTDFADERGRIRFFNEWQLDNIVRLYEIEPADTESIRAWQGHKIENKWFHCTAGAFTINLIQLLDWDQPQKEVNRYTYTLRQDTPEVLWVRAGMASGIKARIPGSRLMVFSDLGLEQSKADDYRFPLEQWTFEEN